jgi:hypothetical protein
MALAADLSALLGQARSAGDVDTRLRNVSEVITVVSKRQRALLPAFFSEIVAFLVCDGCARLGCLRPLLAACALSRGAARACAGPRCLQVHA